MTNRAATHAPNAGDRPTATDASTSSAAAADAARHQGGTSGFTTTRFSGIRHRFRPGFILGIAIMWCLLMGELTWANTIGGLLVGLGIVFALPLPAMPLHGITLSLVPLLRYLAVWAWELIVASFKAGWLALRPQAPPPQAILEVPMRLDNEFILAIAVILYNLQPGGAVSDIDIANRMLTIHILDASSPEAIEKEIQAVARLEAALIRIFERSHI